MREIFDVIEVCGGTDVADFRGLQVANGVRGFRQWRGGLTAIADVEPQCRRGCTILIRGDSASYLPIGDFETSFFSAFGEIKTFGLFFLAARHSKQACSALTRCVSFGPWYAKVSAGPPLSTVTTAWTVRAVRREKSGQPYSLRLLRSHRKYGWGL